MRVLFLNKYYNCNLDWLLGVLVASPFAYPKEPYYWLGFSALLLAGLRFQIKADQLKDLFIILLFNILILIINLINTDSKDLHSLSIVGTIVSSYFFLFRYCLKDNKAFIDGFLFIMSLSAVLVFILFFVLKPYQYGFLFFISSKLRMWANAYTLEWPNVLCVFLVLGAYLNWMRGNRSWTLLHILASLLTTSRMSLLAIVIFLGYYLFNKKINKLYLVLFLIGFTGLIFYLKDNPILDQYLTQRLFKTSDRVIILNSMLDVFKNNIFGIGNVPFTSINDLYQSYHSSYLKVLIRYGFIGLLLFLFLIIPKKPFKHFFIKENAPILFMLISSIFQDLLFHIHLIMMYSVLLALRGTKIKSIQITESNESERVKNLEQEVSSNPSIFIKNRPNIALS